MNRMLNQAVELLSQFILRAYVKVGNRRKRRSRGTYLAA